MPKVIGELERLWLFQFPFFRFFYCLWANSNIIRWVIVPDGYFHLGLNLLSGHLKYQNKTQVDFDSSDGFYWQSWRLSGGKSQQS